jgi:hypothetical protein
MKTKATKNIIQLTSEKKPLHTQSNKNKNKKKHQKKTTKKKSTKTITP